MYKVLQVRLFKLERVGTVIEELKTLTSILNTINTIVQRFQIVQSKSNYNRNSNTSVLLREKEVKAISNSEDKAQSDDEPELGDDSDYFKP